MSARSTELEHPSEDTRLDWAMPDLTRRKLVRSLIRLGRRQPNSTNPLDAHLGELAKGNEFPWAIAAEYWRLRRRDNSLPPGTVFTPPRLAEIVVSRLRPGVDVVDLGAGTGMLTLAAARKGFHVVAIERDPECAAILDAVARILRLRRKISVQVGDALSYRGRAGLQVMANPPYTRHHAIPPKTKQSLAKRIRKLGTALPMTAGYYAYFMVYAWTTSWSEREVLLVPTNWIDARYGEVLRRLSQARGLREIAVINDGHNGVAFDHALTTVCLVTTERGTTLGEKRSIGNCVRPLEKERRIDHSREMPPEDRLLRLKERLGSQIGSASVRHSFLRDVFRTQRGIATGANHFFVLTNSEARALGIPESELRPILRRLTTDPSLEEVASLWVPREKPSVASRRRIKEGQQTGVNLRYLCRQRKLWWKVDLRDPPDYFLSYMGRRRPTIRPNQTGLLSLNNIHGLYLRDGVSPDVGERVANWLSSLDGSRALMKRARCYDGGLWKLEPGEVGEVSLPSHMLRP